MTRGFTSRRKEFIKAVRAKAHSEGTLFRTALDSVRDTDAAKKVLMGNRTPGLSRHNIKWYNDTITLNDSEHRLYDEEVHDFKVEVSNVDNFRHQTEMTVSLLEIARPAKKKGIAKDFEMVKKGRLGDDEFEIWEDAEFQEYEIWEDEWEKIIDEQKVDSRRSYSSVLRGNDR